MKTRLSRAPLLLAAFALSAFSACAQEKAKPPAPTGDAAAPAFVNSIGMKFVRIPAGEFIMGSPPDENRYKIGVGKDETQHKVTISKSFLMGMFPVTRGEYDALMKGVENKEKFGGPPVFKTSWNDALAFCKKLSEKEGRQYRLPTEAEWEYACRAGTTTAYFWGPHADAKVANDYHWGYGNGGGPDRNPADKKPNPWGLYGMFGPVLQWCSDWSGPYEKGPQVDPQGPAKGTSHIHRGIPWDFGHEVCRCACRYDGHPPNDASFAGGYRLVLDMPEPPPANKKKVLPW